MQGIAVAVHDEAVPQRHVVECADFDMHCVVGAAIAHVVDFAQDRVKGLSGRTGLPAARAEVAIPLDKQLQVEANAHAAQGEVGPEAEAIQLLLAHGDAAHAERVAEHGDRGLSRRGDRAGQGE